MQRARAHNFRFKMLVKESTLSSQASKKRESALWSETATPDCCRARKRDGCEVNCAKNALFWTNTHASTAPADAFTRSPSSPPLTTNTKSFCMILSKSAGASTGKHCMAAHVMI
ncbi:hypothetical protein M758_UG133600 [Ceratodon purpureus]|nr:hypothetical protein M758_UG133600 [Ceratodon purpureus]